MCFLAAISRKTREDLDPFKNAHPSSPDKPKIVAQALVDSWTPFCVESPRRLGELCADLALFSVRKPPIVAKRLSLRPDLAAKSTQKKKACVNATARLVP